MPPMTAELETLAEHLRSSNTGVRLSAVERLQQMAMSGDYNAIELLTQSMKSDQNMDVRIAATDAIAAIEDPHVSQRPEELVPPSEVDSEIPSRISLLKSAWRR